MKNRIPGYLYLLIGFVLLMLGMACNSDLQSQFTPEPNAIGRAGQLNVLCEDELWEQVTGDTFTYYFGSSYPILPQPEPNFDIRQFNMKDLDANPVYSELRTFLLLADLSDKESPVTQMVYKDIGKLKIEEAMGEKGYGAKVGKDKWAKGQLILYLFATDKNRLYEGIVRSYPAFSERIRSFDADQIEATVYLEGLNMTLINKLESDWGVKMRIPSKFEEAIEDNPFIWLRYELPESSSSLMFYRVPYRDTFQLTREGVKQLRDSITRQYISSTIDSTYVVVNDQDLPLFYYERDINGQFTVELRGIWEMVNDFLGGPFQSYAILDKARGEILFIDAFVYAPGEDKRDLMEKLKHIVETAEIAGP